MAVEEAAIPGVWVFTPLRHHDDRGEFVEYFDGALVRELAGEEFFPVQANVSVSVAGALRGIHAAQVPRGQRKYVTCARGAAFDVAVDLRIGSPTYGQWTAVLLDDVARRGVYLPDGIGHAFLSLADDTTMLYLCSTPYTPEREFDINPFDPHLSIDWPTVDRQGRAIRYRQSEKDRRAPDLAATRAAGLLPTLSACDAGVADDAPPVSGGL